jgi:hypothetical protein
VESIDTFIIDAGVTSRAIAAELAVGAFDLTLTSAGR